MSFQFKIWVPEHAYLYLPIYAVEEFGILERVAKENGLILDENEPIKIVKATFDYGGIQHQGDKSAAAKMLLESESTSSTINISIGDPLDAIEADNDNGNLRIVGSLLKRPPFWLIGNGSLDELSDEQSDTKLWYYNSDFATGFSFGQKLEQNYSLRPSRRSDTLELGNEVDIFFSEDNLYRGQKNVVLTADLLGLSRALKKDSTPIKILRSYASEPENANFVTTCIATHKNNIKNSGLAINVFLRAVAISSSMFSTAKEPVIDLCKQISKDSRFDEQFIIDEADANLINDDTREERLSDSEASQLVDLIMKDGLFDDRLSISFDEWCGSVNSRTDDLVAPNKKSALKRKYFSIYKSLDVIDKSLPLSPTIPKPKYFSKYAISWPTPTELALHILLIGLIYSAATILSSHAPNLAIFFKMSVIIPLIFITPLVVELLRMVLIIFKNNKKAPCITFKRVIAVFLAVVIGSAFAYIFNRDELVKLSLGTIFIQLLIYGFWRPNQVDAKS